MALPRYQRKAEIFMFLISLLAVDVVSAGRLFSRCITLSAKIRKPYTTVDCSAAPQQTFTNMHKSVFSYNLSRPYPYTWFTWVVVIGGILATAIFSFVNLVADGYELVYDISKHYYSYTRHTLTLLSVVTSSHPNATIAEASSRWYGKWSLSNKVLYSSYLIGPRLIQDDYRLRRPAKHRIFQLDRVCALC